MCSLRSAGRRYASAMLMLQTRITKWLDKSYMTVNVFQEALRTVTGDSHTRLSGKRQRVIRRSSL